MQMVIQSLPDDSHGLTPGVSGYTGEQQPSGAERKSLTSSQDNKFPRAKLARQLAVRSTGAQH
jgi:hypothetical protein